MPKADGQILTGELADINTLETPDKVAPKAISIENAGPSFPYSFAPHSVTVARFKTQ